MPLHGKRHVLRAGFMIAMLGVLLSGCSLIAPTTDVVEPVVLPPQLPPTPNTDIRVVVPVTEPHIEETEPPQPPPEPMPIKVAIVLSSRVPAYEDVAVALSEMLDAVEIYDLSDKSLTQKEAFDAIHSSGVQVVVAVGLRAATFTQSITRVPVVFSQVFNDSNLTGENLKGVAAIPPLDMQLRAWRQINPELRNIGAILGEGHQRLIEEAMQAADANDAELHYRLAKSDRETLYLFTRLVPDIDGFWLFPDNRILSSSILREMLAYASRHRIQVAVFNDSLLSLGAAISTTSVNADIAQTIMSVIKNVTSREAESVPVRTPLSQIDVKTNIEFTQSVVKDVSGRSEETL
ncbi:MAG: hypothetical protein GXP15_08700 [Gammaproteobacteria bacterium]|nr:hypothetical protein [Gammaproteobacteria bacterium]